MNTLKVTTSPNQRGIRRRLDKAKTSWAEELHTTPHSITGESPFRLTHETDAVIPIELNKLSWRTGVDTNFQANTENLHEELEFVDEIISEAALREIALKQKIAAHHNKRVIKR